MGDEMVDAPVVARARHILNLIQGQGSAQNR
jgi:hypothetical protein